MGTDPTATPGFPTTQLQVRFHELDPYGHVNHAVYVNYLETARLDVLDHLGLGIDELRARDLHLIVVEVNLKFRAPAIARDILTITTELRELRRASSWWFQRITRAGSEVVAEAMVRAASVDHAGRPKGTPPDLLAMVEPYVIAAPASNGVTPTAPAVVASG